ncbi:Polyketide cyclase / dehydrase and lipid transport [Rhodococcoides kroppenstedtii]|uniref:Polyketide cyclase / dehydrase and lipid transport n=1 Tax=Rhodococcoides kroppenstedtii TaxID=293050 RepID=A0A1I0UAZ8_9NOCA|nr:SRPBCC family protein [Rhodococcus kroppenstedtii]SFA61205.1 Polyketide cyclase / dehydrase and lipid transport [Rhodococcus kroppenstedtii]
MTSPAGPALASGTTTVRVAPDAVFALVTDLSGLASVAVEAESMEWVSGTRAAPGAVFRGHNRNGLRRWSTRCTVTDTTEGRVFAFDVDYGPRGIVPIAHWRYDLEPTENGTLVTERMWDRRPSWFVGLGGFATGVRDRAAGNTANIEATLDRLRVVLERGGAH